MVRFLTVASCHLFSISSPSSPHSLSRLLLPFFKTSSMTMAIAVGTHMYTLLAWLYLNSSISVRSFSVKTFPTIHTDDGLVFSSLPFTFCCLFPLLVLLIRLPLHMAKQKTSDFICCCCCLVVLVVCSIQLACCCCHIVIAITFLGCSTSRFYIYLRFVCFQLHCFSHKIVPLSSFLASSCMNFFSSSFSERIFFKWYYALL